MVHVYHVDPVRLYLISQSRYAFLIEHLTDQLTAIEARELHLSAVAAITPFRKPADVRNAFKRWQKMYSVRPIKRRPRFVEYNPDKAKAWFESLGYTVVHKPESDGS